MTEPRRAPDYVYGVRQLRPLTDFEAMAPKAHEQFAGGIVAEVWTSRSRTYRKEVRIILTDSSVIEYTEDDEGAFRLKSAMFTPTRNGNHLKEAL